MFVVRLAIRELDSNYGVQGIVKQGVYKVFPVSSPHAPLKIHFISTVHPGNWLSQGTCDYANTLARVGESVESALSALAPISFGS